jgi:uncharacterized membrane protein YhfC
LTSKPPVPYDDAAVLALSYLVQVALMMVGLPVGLWLVLRRRWGTSWRLVAVGALAFVASQVVHLPLVYALTTLMMQPGVPKPPESMKLAFNAVVLGLLAALCEEVANYVALRRWLPRARGFRAAIGFGAGHGGGESVILGVIAAGTFVFMALRRGAEAGVAGLPGGQAERLARSVAGYWSVPPWLPLLGGVERAFGILVHLSTSVLVMLCFVRGALWPLLAAIGWHAFVDGTVVYAAGRFGLPATEAAVAAFGVASVAIIRWARPALDGGGLPAGSFGAGTPPAKDR